MSQQTQGQEDQLAHFAGIVISLALIIIFALIPASSRADISTVASPTADEGQVVVQVTPTDTPQATATVRPSHTPSDTPAPTSTPLPSITSTSTATETAQVTANDHQSADPAVAVAYDPVLVSQGETLFLLCAACHGPDARGLPNLGKDLVESEFVAAQTDDALVQFIITGRPIWDPLNTTGIDMPGKGGNPVLTAEEIQAIVAYLRTLSAEHSGGAEAAPVSNESTAYDPALVAQGEQLFMLCAACHGPDARGLPNLGKDLVASEFVAGLTDDALLDFIKTGRPIWDPLNTTGMDMPGKGGNPAMTDDDILAVIAYVRSLSAGGE